MLGILLSLALCWLLVKWFYKVIYVIKNRLFTFACYHITAGKFFGKCLANLILQSFGDEETLVNG